MCIQTFPNRYDNSYLDCIAKALQISSLKKNHLKIKLKLPENKEFKKCISIDFTGISASTLLSSISEKDSPLNIPGKKRQTASELFRKLLETDTLNKLNAEGFYVRVRFCFAYLFSDFPISMLKAELPESWENMADIAVQNFYINPPLTKEEFNDSSIKHFQVKALKEIQEIIRNNQNLIIFGDPKEKKANSVQVRFSVIPSPVCTLFINDRAFCDPYLYAKTSQEGRLSSNMPVLMLEKGDPRTGEAYHSIRQHFNYIWRHDQTLFCSDATEFSVSPRSWKLFSILDPEKVLAKKWSHKEKRISDKINKEHENAPLDPNFIITEGQIKGWKKNLDTKFLRSTRMLQSKKAGIDADRTSVRIDMRRKHFYFHILIPDEKAEFEFLRHSPNLLYSALAHYAYAKLKGQEPVLHDWYIDPPRIMTYLGRNLNSANLDNDKPTDNDGIGHYCIKKLFSWDKINQILHLNLEQDQIEFNFDAYDEIARASYSAHGTDNGHKSCLEFDPA